MLELWLCGVWMRLPKRLTEKTGKAWETYEIIRRVTIYDPKGNPLPGFPVFTNDPAKLAYYEAAANANNLVIDMDYSRVEWRAA